jgi:hypothetical protein
VRLVTIGGQVVVEDGRLIALNEAEIVADAQRQRAALLDRLKA